MQAAKLKVPPVIEGHSMDDGSFRMPALVGATTFETIPEKLFFPAPPEPVTSVLATVNTTCICIAYARYLSYWECCL